MAAAARPFDPPDDLVLAYLRGLEDAARPSAPAREVERAAPSGVASGALGYASGGPAWLDAFHSKRPPTPSELVNAYKAVAFACVRLNQHGVQRVPLRLYARTRAGQRKPRRSYREVPVARQRHLRGLVGRDERAYAWSRTDLARSIGDGDEIHEVTESPFLDAIENPNPYFDRPTLLAYWVACLDVVGQAFTYADRPLGADGYGDPTWAPAELWPLQPQYVFPVRGTGRDVLLHWRYFGDTFSPTDLVRVRNVSLRDPYLSGYAPLHACFEQNGLMDYYTASVEGILRGGAMPAGVISSADPNVPILEDEAARLETEINNRQTGASKGRWWIQRTPLKVDVLSFKPTDLGGLELTKQQRLLAANCFDVPISLLQSEDSNRATAQESTYQHQYYAIAPRCCLIDTALTHQVVRPVDDRQFFAFDDPVERDVAKQVTVFDMEIKNGTRTINEARRERGMEDVPWGDGPPAALTPPAAAPDATAKPHAEPDGDEAPAPASKPGVPAKGTPAGDVQKQALNGAQVDALTKLVDAVGTGALPKPSARAIIAASFPAFDAALVAAIVDPIEVREPAEAPAVPPPPPTPDTEDDDEEGDDEPTEAQRSLHQRLNLILDQVERSLTE